MIDDYIKSIQNLKDDNGFIKINKSELLDALKKSSAKIESLNTHIERLNIGYENLSLLANKFNEEIYSSLSNDQVTCKYGNCT